MFAVTIRLLCVLPLPGAIASGAGRAGHQRRTQSENALMHIETTARALKVGPVPDPATLADVTVPPGDGVTRLVRRPGR
jgi:hypothetical protein